jgi:predicted transcriptional regulator
MTKSASELLEMKEEIDQADKRKSELQGQRKELLSRIKKDFGCSSSDEGAKKLDKLQVTLEKEQRRLGAGITNLKRKMEEVDG